ncbi:PASTA domain-containing protein [Humitalea sp. 24SJ18S-53]|uniref:PASTA domain-containing protein n=1 Tax=Humitalea sp. 24SJ18S-53 TaxID=3422307 RepID=UPI003D664B88
MPSDEMSRRITALEGALSVARAEAADIAGLRERLAKVEAATKPGIDAPDVVVLKREVEVLRAEKIELEERLRVVSAPRLETTPVQLSEGFRAAALTLRDGLAPRPGDRGAFALADLQVGVKTMLAVAPDGTLRFVLPAPGERPDALALSELRFTLRAAEVAGPDLTLITVPVLLGLPQAAAETALTRAGLKPGAMTTRESDYATGTVIAQDPEPGVEIPADIGVALTLAAPPTVAVPDCAGLTLEAATALIEAAALRLGAVTGEGVVVAQQPIAAARLARGAEVALTLRPPARRVPDVAGLNRDDATRMLADAGLMVGGITETPGGTVGRVGAQEVAAGTEVPPGSRVGLTIGSGPGLDELLARTVKAAAESRSGISGGLLRDRLKAAGLKTVADFAALAGASDEVLQKAIGAPTPRGLVDARAAMKRALE